MSTLSWWQTTYRTGARVQTIHKIPSIGEKLDGELQTAGSVLGKRNAKRPYLHWNHKVVRAVPQKTSPRSSALRGPSSTSSRLIPSSPLLLLLSSPLQLLDKFADVNKHSVSAAKALWWNNTWKRRGKTRPERPGEAAMYVRGCSCKTRAEKINNKQQARNFHHLLLKKYI